MAFDSKTVKAAAAYEEKFGARPQPLPKGLILHAAFDGAASEVDESGNPAFSLAVKIQGGEYDGRTIGKKFWWYASETSQSETPYEVRQKSIRARVAHQLEDIVDAISGSPEAEAETAAQVLAAVSAMDQDDPAEVVELMEAVINLLDGQDLYVKTTHRKDKDDKTRVYLGWSPVQDYAKAAAKVNGTDEDV